MSCVKSHFSKKVDIIWLILVFLYIVGATGYIFTAGIIPGVIMLANLAIFCSLVYQRHQRLGVWQLPLPPKSTGLSTKDVVANTASKGKGKGKV